MASERFDSLALSVPTAIADEATLSALISPLDKEMRDAVEGNDCSGSSVVPVTAFTLLNSGCATAEADMCPGV